MAGNERIAFVIGDFDEFLECAEMSTPEDRQKDMERMRGMMAHCFGPVIEHEAGDMPSPRERVVVIDGAPGALVARMTVLEREAWEEAHGVEIISVRDDPMPPAFDTLMREVRPNHMVVRLQQPLHMEKLDLPPEPKKSKWEELREPPKSAKRGYGKTVKLLHKPKG